MAFNERQLVVVVFDLAHFATAVAGLSAVEIAEIVNRYYSDVSDVVSEHGGTVVKYIGDGCLVVFPADRAVAAVDAVEAVEPRVEALAHDFDLDLSMGANVHLCLVAEGGFGPDDQYDIMGAGVMHAFRMGGGRGIRISEPVYRKLPNERRAAWAKHQPPATYTRSVA